MRLIDADALPKWTGYALSATEIAIEVEHAPTIDAVPVKYGKWIHGREVSRDYVGDACVCIRYEKWWCSECNYTVDLYKPLWHYCPNCGACMTTKTPIDKDGLAY